jgi:hypothetical protein
LAAIVRSAKGLDGVLSPGELPSGNAAYLPLLSAPRLFTRSLAEIPRVVPYLSADATRVAMWRERLAGVGPYRVGIAWQGNPSYVGDSRRSIPLLQFTGLASCANVRLVSLQKGHGREQLQVLRERLAIHNPGDAIDTQGAFVDTAALMCNMDLVITSDTAIAHLAGALGVRTWVALAHVPDWRWLLTREDSPWYPSLRLFRQPRADDWVSVFAQMQVELSALAACK